VTVPLSLMAVRRTAMFRPHLARFLVDVQAWVVALGLAVYQQDHLAATPVRPRAVLLGVLAVAAGQLAAGLATGVYRGRYRVSSFDELLPLALTVAAATALLVVAEAPVGPAGHLLWVSAASAGFYALLLMGGARATWRLLSERAARQRHAGAAVALVFGAGDAGTQLVRSLLKDARSAYVPVALLDDDLSKQKLRLCGVPVLGGHEDLRSAARRVGADALLIAIPSATAALIAHLTTEAEACGLVVKVLPSLAELLDPDHVDAQDIRDVTPGDLLGRRPIVTDVDSVADYIRGKRVLVTGAGGSIGSELCKQLVRHHPAQLVMLDRDESALHAVQLAIAGRALLDDQGLVLVDIRDSESLRRIFSARRPEVVFHAAALKHLPLLERHPGEAVRSNVIGTLNVLEAASSVGVRQFVNVSTDKAADPSSVLGYSKRIGERLTADFADCADGTYLSVRFGNVVGSRGSVLDAFQSQIRTGGPVTVTDPDVTRYFMTVHEAVQLVIQAGGIGRPGEVLVFDMGTPVSIRSVAEMLIRMADQPIEIEYTGLRPGEKMHEQLLGPGERDDRPFHPLISQVSVPPLPPFVARGLNPGTPRERLIGELRALSVSEHVWELPPQLRTMESVSLTRRASGE
jgi:FlaA1/EpsC-like NDP-sugar epimerase